MGTGTDTTISGRGARATISDRAMTAVAALLQSDLTVQRENANGQRQTIADAAAHERPSFNDIMDRATAEELLRRTEQVIADIEHALQRISDGTYGCCERCARPIPFERLEAIPEARLCVTCQSRASAANLITPR
jgi:RNA polymerase-binding protein DksA